MQGHRLALLLVPAAAVLAAGCARRIATPPAAAGCVLRVDEDRFFCGEAPYATVERYFCRSPRPENDSASSQERADGVAGPSGNSCFGLAVVYADGARAWLHRGRNWESAVRDGRYTPIGDTEGKLGGAYDIHLTADGWVRFQLPLRAGVSEYQVTEGVLR
jgi:hypothetical protein